MLLKKVFFQQHRSTFPVPDVERNVRFAPELIAGDETGHCQPDGGVSLAQ
jgi:hypothetical protein